MKVSVIMPNYNKGKYVKDAIDSVLAQTYTDFELIIVDGGSTDESLPIIEEYVAKDGRITLISAPHKGVSASRNLGIERSQGQLIAFLDSDDIYHNEKLMKQTHEYKDSRNFISHTDGWIIDGSGMSAGRRYSQTYDYMPKGTRDGNIFANLIRYDNFVLTGSVMLPREFFKYEEFDPRFSAAEDFDLWLRLAHRFPYRYLPDALYGWRKFEGNTWRPANRTRNIRDGIAIRKKWLSMFDDLTSSDKERITYQLLKRYLIVKDYPGLGVFCLSNRTALRLLARKLRSRLS